MVLERILPTPHGRPDYDLFTVRRRLLWGIYVALWVLGLPAVIIAGFEAFELGKVASLGLYASLYLLFTVTTIFYRRLPMGFCAGVVLAMLYLVSLSNLVWFSFGGAGLEIGLTVCVLATLLLGVRAGLSIIALYLASVTAVGCAFVYDILTIVPQMPATTGYGASWATAGAVFALLAGASVIGSGLLQRHLIQSLVKVRNQAEELKKTNEDLSKEALRRKNAEDKLGQARKMESLGTLAGGIAHDFNNILSAVIGYTELAMARLEDRSAPAEYLREVCLAGDRAKDLVNQILTFARQSTEEVKPVQVGAIVKEVGRLLRSTIPTTIDIRVVVESESLVMGNATQIHQIFMNLCTNAAHAMEADGGDLSVDVRDVALDGETLSFSVDLPQGDYLKVAVSDTGEGMAPEILDTIFEPYFTTKGPGEGTGMGLAMVHGIVNSYGGGIHVESRPGQGSIFTVFLPVTHKTAAKETQIEQTPPGGQERILFVDDEGPIARMGAKMLEMAGYRVDARTSSLEALELFQKRPDDFDLVITDMTMPNMTGEKLAKEILAIRPQVPVILCTGYSHKISEASAAEIGLRALAVKPVGRGDLLRMVRRVLDG